MFAWIRVAPAPDSDALLPECSNIGPCFCMPDSSATLLLSSHPGRRHRARDRARLALSFSVIGVARVL